MAVAYLVLVGLPMLGLLGILEAGRNISAALAIGGDWNLEFAADPQCASGSATLRQPALSISQSGREAQITLNDGHATTLPAILNGNVVSAKLLTATVTGKPESRTIEGRISLAGCAPVAFRAVRASPQKRGE